MTDKPSIKWEQIAPEFTWLAKDPNGDVRIFSGKPHINGPGTCWSGFGLDHFDVGFLASCKAGSCDWKDSLVERPEQQEETWNPLFFWK